MSYPRYIGIVAVVVSLTVPVHGDRMVEQDVRTSHTYELTFHMTIQTNQADLATVRSEFQKCMTDEIGESIDLPTGLNYTLTSGSVDTVTAK